MRLLRDPENCKYLETNQHPYCAFLVVVKFVTKLVHFSGYATKLVVIG